jgi:hypothetical protein
LCPMSGPLPRTQRWWHRAIRPPSVEGVRTSG